MFTHRFRYRESNWIEMVSEYFWRTFCGGQNHPFQSLNSCFTWSVSQSILRILYVCFVSCVFVSRLVFCLLCYYWITENATEKKNTLQNICVLNVPLTLIIALKIHSKLFMHNRSLSSFSIQNANISPFFFFYLAQTRYKWRAKKNSDNHM